jgi:hypothetical protein
VSSPSEEGISPVNWLSKRKRYSREERSPKEDAIVPVSPLDCRFLKEGLVNMQHTSP